MTDEDRMARRIRLAEVVGWTAIERTGKYCTGKPPDGASSLNPLPAYDTDPAAREGLLEWSLQSPGFDRVEFDFYHWNTDKWGVSVTPHGQDGAQTVWAATLAEALLSAIDAALLARTSGKETEGAP